MNILLLTPLHKMITKEDKLNNRYFSKGQAQQSWIEALDNLGHKVYIFYYTDSILLPRNINIDFQEITKKIFPIWYGRIRRIGDRYYKFIPSAWIKNRNVLNYAKKIIPDQVWLSGGFQDIFPNTLQEIKKKFSARILLFSGVSPLIAATFSEKEMVAKKIVDLVVENDEGYARLWKRLGAKKVVVSPISSVDPRLHKKINLGENEREIYGSDVVFVGTLWMERQRILTSLLDFDLKIWGDIPFGIKLSKELKKAYQGIASGETMVKIFNTSKIIINFQPKDMTKGANMRTFEINGCGGFQLTDKIDDRWFTPNKEVVIFNDLVDLKKKIEFYLKDDRKRKSIALAGYKRAHKDHTYEKHFKRLLS